jgi:hypothetical protein
MGVFSSFLPEFLSLQQAAAHPLSCIQSVTREIIAHVRISSSPAFGKSNLPGTHHPHVDSCDAPDPLPPLQEALQVLHGSWTGLGI